MGIEVELEPLRIRCRGMSLSEIELLVDGRVPSHSGAVVQDGALSWTLEDCTATLAVEGGDTPRLILRLDNVPPGRAIASLGLRIGRAKGIGFYLRNGYHSWDGSFFVEPGTPAGDGPPDKAPTLGFAMTALLPGSEPGALVLGFTRHERFQTRFDFGGGRAAATIDLQTLWDKAPHAGTVTAAPLVLVDHEEVEECLRCWSRIVAREAPLAPRIPPRRITGWCSWYNLYAAISEQNVLDHLRAARAFRDRHQVPLDIFQIDDGFTPEMGDWLEVRPQFPRGMKALIGDIAATGFTPGLWIAPFLVGNRSRLFAEHPDWMVQAVSGGPLVHMKFYGEFRWHKRSEEYHVLDVTHPDAADYIRRVFRTWRHEWGAGYFKTDFMNAGMDYGPDQARWHETGLARAEIWRRMAGIVREGIGDALWLGCGCPLWASVGLVDAVRIGRDVGVSWNGDYSAQSLLRDQLTRNHASGILWQADPDCILLRERFHELTDREVRSLAVFAGLAGGVLMTSDKLDELPAERAQLFADLLSAPVRACAFPQLGRSDGLIVQRAIGAAGESKLNVFNTGETPLRFDPGELGLQGAAVDIAPHDSLCFGG